MKEKHSDDRRVGYDCPRCHQFVKLYSRTFNSNMACALLVLYRNRDKGFVHLENLMSEQGYKRCGDASYLRHYQLIEALNEERKDGSKRNGMYKITGRGIMFCEKKLKVQKKFLIYNNQLEGFEGEEVGIEEVLGEKFNYSKLMEDSTLISKRRKHTIEMIDNPLFREIL